MLHRLALSLLLLLPAASADAHEFRIGSLKVAHPWSRATPPAAKVAGGYLRIVNTSDAADRLVAATAESAGRVEIHEMSITDGIMRMRELPSGLPIAANATAEMKPGGFHLMLLDIKAPFKVGDKVRGTLIFERAGTVEIEFAVETMGATADAAHNHPAAP